MKSRWCVLAGKRYIFGMMLLGLMFGLISGSAQAQDQGKITLFGGYSWLSNNWGENVGEYDEYAVYAFRAVTPDVDYEYGTGIGDTGLSGYTGSFVYNFNEHIGLEANFSGHNGSPTVYTEPSTSTETGYRDFERQDFSFLHLRTEAYPAASQGLCRFRPRSGRRSARPHWIYRMHLTGGKRRL